VIHSRTHEGAAAGEYIYILDWNSNSNEQYIYIYIFAVFHGYRQLRIPPPPDEAAGEGAAGAAQDGNLKAQVRGAVSCHVSCTRVFLAHASGAVSSSTACKRVCAHTHAHKHVRTRAPISIIPLAAGRAGRARHTHTCEHVSPDRCPLQLEELDTHTRANT